MYDKKLNFLVPIIETYSLAERVNFYQPIFLTENKFFIASSKNKGVINKNVFISLENGDKGDLIKASSKIKIKSFNQNFKEGQPLYLKDEYISNVKPSKEDGDLLLLRLGYVLIDYIVYIDIGEVKILN